MQMEMNDQASFCDNLVRPLKEAKVFLDINYW